MKHFDPIRARQTAMRLREQGERIRAKMPPLPVRPLFAGETSKNPKDKVITSIGSVTSSVGAAQ